MIFNPYTNTNDFPEIFDFYPVDATGKKVFDKTQWFKYGVSQSSVLNAFNAAMMAWLTKYNIPQSVRDEWNASQTTGEDSNTFWQRMKAKFQNAVNTVTTVKNDAIQTAKEAVSNVNDTTRTKALLLLLTPLVPVANIFLKRKGITPSTNPAQLVQQIYNEQSRSNFGYSSQKQDSFDYVGLKGTGHFEKFGFGPEDISPEMVSAVLQFLTGILNSIKAKKAANQPLTDDEKKIIDLLPSIEAAPEALDAEGFKIFGFDWKKILAVIILLVLVWYFGFRK